LFYVFLIILAFVFLICCWLNPTQWGLDFQKLLLIIYLFLIIYKIIRSFSGVQGAVFQKSPWPSETFLDNEYITYR
jgi:hypothetical protein